MESFNSSWARRGVDTICVTGKLPDEPEYPATWGQLFQWEILDLLGGTDSSKIDIRIVRPIPEGHSISSVTAVLLALYQRHDSLRSVFVGQSVNDLRQCVRPQIRLELRFYDADGDSREIAGEIADSCLDIPFDFATSVSRAAIVSVRGAPRWIVLVTSHVIADYWSARQLIRELDILLSGRQLSDRCERQPWDAHVFEMSPSGLRRERASLRYWERTMADANGTATLDARDPRDMDPPSPRYPEGALESSSLFADAAQAAKRHGVRSSAIIVGALGLELCRYFNLERLAVLLRTANRLDRWARSIITTSAQQAPLLIDPGITDATAFYRSVANGAVLATKYSYFAPRNLNSLVERVRSVGVNPFPVTCVVNFVPRESVPTTTSFETEGSKTNLDRFSWVRGFDTSQLTTNSNIYEEVSWLSLSADLTLVPRSDIELIVRRTQASIHQAATASS